MPLDLVALGGLGEFGRNLLWMRCGASSLVVDAGIGFPDETFPGVDRIAPDLSVLEGVPIEAILLTHGHEDHIGALPMLAELCDAPVYGFPFTLALARRRLEEAGRTGVRLIAAAPRQKYSAGPFRFAFFRVSHSVPDSAAVWIEAEGTRTLHSGDFKLDPDPPDGELTDHEGIAEVARAGIDLALVDSTNAELPGRAASERLAGEGLAAAFEGAPGRIVVTTFSSHVARIAQAVEAGRLSGRRAGLLGRSMRTVVEISERMGRLSFPASRIAPSDLSAQPPRRLLCLVSGSQGEPSSALARLAMDEHADLRLEPGDQVIFSARTIPGHERSVNRVIDQIIRRGARVVRESDPPVHVSGHAHRDDIADWLRRVRPSSVLPLHGERRMQAAAAQVAADCGISPERIYVLDNGDRLSRVGDSFAVEAGAVAVSRIYFDDRAERIAPAVLADRRQMGQEGFVAVSLSSCEKDAQVIVTSRGVAAAPADLVREVRLAAASVLARSGRGDRRDPESLRAEIVLAVRRACRRAFDVRPVVEVLAPETGGRQTS